MRTLRFDEEDNAYEYCSHPGSETPPFWQLQAAESSSLGIILTTSMIG